MKLASALAAAALIPAALVSVPAQASAPVGCAADDELQERVLVKKKPIRTEDGERFGVLRFFAGEVYDEPLGDTATGTFYPAYCLDLVVADEFAGRTPRHQGSVTGDGFVDYLYGRAATGQLSGGNGSDLEGQVLTVTYEVKGRSIRASRTMRAEVPVIN